jgi:hypothetical protein
MVDLRVITILPQQPIGVQQPSNAQSSVYGSQNAISNLTPGTVLTGFIVNRDASGNPVLRTVESGDITFVSNFFLKIGSEVQIRIENIAGSILAHILSVDGQSPEAAEAQSSFASRPDVILSQAILSREPLSTQAQPAIAQQTGNTPAPLLPSSIISGTLVALPRDVANIPTLPFGTQLSFRLIAVNIPAASGSTYAQTPSQPASGVAPPYAAYARASGGQITPTAATPTNLAGTASAPPAQSQTSVTVSAANVAQNPSPLAANTVATTGANSVLVQPSTPNEAKGQPLTVAANPNASSNTFSGSSVIYTPATATQPAIPQAGQNIFATVVSNEPGGEVLAQTPLGVVRLQTGGNVPVGSKITFEIFETILPAAQQAGLANTVEPAPLTELAKHWHSLEQIFKLLSGRDSASGMDFIQPNMPWLRMNEGANLQTLLTPKSLPSGMMFFLNALGAGSFRDWLGRNNAQWLDENGHSMLLQKAGAEFMSISKQFQEVTPQQWQTLFFPVAVEGEVQQARLFVKRDRKQGNKQQNEKSNDDTRFILEVDMSQLGEMQMDGFVRKGDQQTHFDLVIRSKTPLPADVQNDLAQIYNDTGELTGYRGSLQFQSVKEFPIQPMEETGAKPHNNLMA